MSFPATTPGIGVLPDHRTNPLRAWAIRALFLVTWPVLVAPGVVRRALRRQPRPRRVFFFHVRKTAGTSLAKAYETLGGESADAVQKRLSRLGLSAWSGPYHYVHKGDSVILRLSPYSFGWSHIPAWKFRVAPDTFTVTILRDPIARVISLYNYLANPTVEQGEQFQAKAFARDLAAGGLEAFVRDAPRPFLLNQLFMFSESLDPAEAAERIRALSMWFFTESYPTGAQELGAALGVELPVRADRAGNTKRNQPDDAVRAVLKDVLQPEYELLELFRADPGPGFVGQFP